RYHHPPVVVQDLLRLGGIEGVARLELVEPAIHTLGEDADGGTVDPEVELVDDRLAVHCPVERLAHRELRRGWALDVDEEADRWAAAHGLDEGEPGVGLE